MHESRMAYELRHNTISRLIRIAKSRSHFGSPRRFAAFRPRIGKRTRRGADGPGGPLLRSEVLLGSALDGGVRRRASAGPSARRGASPDARRVVVKARVVRLTAYGAKAAALHLRYIERDGVEKDGSQGRALRAGGPVRRRTFEEPRLRRDSTSFGSSSRPKTPASSISRRTSVA